MIIWLNIVDVFKILLRLSLTTSKKVITFLTSVFIVNLTLGWLESGIKKNLFASLCELKTEKS